MRTKSKRLFRRLSGAILAVVACGAIGATAMAGNTDYITTLSVGASSVVDIDAGIRSEHSNTLLVNDSVSEAKIEQPTQPEEKAKEAADEEDVEQSGLVMANVQNTLNVRAEADEDSDRVGYLYADCGGEILERKKGWTKLKSGNVEGWAKDEYLLFGEDAEEMARDVGNLIVVNNVDALRVRKEPSESAGVYGLIAKEDELVVLEELNGWVSIQYGKDTGYVSEEFVTVDFHIDAGETVEELKAREKKEAEEKAKRIQNRGAVAVEAADDVLLGALIWCEAGNQSYEGQLAVGAVVMNRVRSGAYPNTVSGVIYASGQFTPAMTGRLAGRLEKGNIPASCMQAAQEAIAGSTNVGGATHFRRAGSREGQIIGDHVFW